MNQPIITRRAGGEYSTVELVGGIIETMWFGDDGSQVMVDRTYLPTAQAIAAEHIARYESK